MPCSAVTLSLATITAIVAVALLAIAFSTDNWLYVDVKRSKIQTYAQRSGQDSLKSSIDSKYIYFTRTKGLFRICYPKERPTKVPLYLSPVETHCMNIDYFIPDVDNQTKQFSEDAMTRLHMGRSMIALFILAFFTVFIAFWTGVAGCWRRSPGNITATAILMLFSCLLTAGGMGLWHGVEYYEKEKVIGEEFYQQWDNVLRDNATSWYGWSYILAWLSVGFSLISSTLFFGATYCLRTEKEEENAKNVQYIMPKVLRDNTDITYDWSYIIAWIGVGWALVSAIMFSAAAICLRNEREKEEAMNMQYMMPVHPQKQQYAYGYSYAYPGPYYHGSQYGPYNY